MNIII